MKYISGLLLGILFGYVLKRSRLCFTGLIRDIYLMGKRFNVVFFLVMISVQAFIYYLFGTLGYVRIPAYLPPFSLFSIALGSFLFGFGAVLASGCMTMTLVKCGDGRVAGWLYLCCFMLSAYMVAAGPLIGVSKNIRRIALVDDAINIRTSVIPLVLSGIVSAILVVLLIRHYSKYNIHIEKQTKHSGLLSILFEKVWPEELGPVAAGIVLGMAYPISSAVGRHYGVSITSPIMSYVYLFTHPVETCGGCNPYDEAFGWGSMFVLGIIVGSLITAALGNELKLIIPRKKELLRGVLGSILMGAGAMWGLGCLLGNGIVGTSQLSIKAWYALIFLSLGIWSATRITIIPITRD